MKNVVVVSNMYPTVQDMVYGSFVKEQVNELRDRNVNIKLIVDGSRAEGNKVKAIKKYASLWTRTLLAAFNPNNKIFHFHYVYPTAMTAPILKYLFRKKIILTFHGSDILKNQNSKNTMLSSILKSADENIAVSEYLKNEVEKRDDVKGGIHAINCGVNIEMFKPYAKELARDESGIAHKFTVLFVGNLIKEKGMEELIQVIEELKTMQDIQFVIVGNGPYKEQLEKLSLENENVIFKGPVLKSKLPKIYAASDCLLFPTHREAFGLVALEASAVGRPVIANQVGGVPEIIDDQTTGYLNHDGEVGRYVKSILNLYHSPSTTNTMGRNAYKKAQQYSIDQQIERVLEIYKGLGVKND